jgi:hypothetical protein
MLAEKELHSCQPTKMKTSFMPHPASTAPYRIATPSRAHSSMTPLASRAPSTSSTPSATTPYAMDPSKASVLQRVAVAAKTSSSTISTSRTSDIKCHHCHGISHFQRDCPSKKSYITTPDGDCVSASDNEDDFALQTNHAGDLADDDNAQVFGSEHTTEYSTKTYVVQWVLSAHMDHSENLQ